MTKHLPFTLSLVAGAALCHAQNNLVANGDFEAPGDNNGALHWPAPKDGISYPVEDGNRFLRVTQTEAGKNTMMYHPVAIPKGTGGLKMSFRARWKDVERGEQSWFDARIMMVFKDANHGDVPGAKQPGAPNFHGTNNEWQARELKFAVPEGAAFLALMPALFHAKRGTLELDDFNIIALDAAAWQADELATARAKAAEEFAGFVWSELMPLPEGVKTPPLKVQGNRLVAMREGVVRFFGKPENVKAGDEIWLQGVAIASMEWSAGGENILKSVDHSINVWGVNIIRLGVKANFWFGYGPWQSDKGKKYRELVDQAVTIAQQSGVYVVIDLHEYRAASGRHAEFWRDVATRYANHPGVIFGLLNEPHGISWKEWRDGGELGEAREKVGVFMENQENLGAVESVGMQYLLDVVRRAGARNLVSAGGLDWAYDLSGILEGFALTDTADGQGVMYETHVYPWKSNWQKAFLDAAEKHPILVGEVGCMVEPMPWQNGVTEDPYIWAPDMIGAMQKHRLNYTAWCFHPSSSPCLLKNWDYEPTPYWGDFVMRALKGEQFEMKKQR